MKVNRKILFLVLLSLSPAVAYTLLMGSAFAGFLIYQEEGNLFFNLTSLLGSRYEMKVTVVHDADTLMLHSELLNSNIILPSYFPSSHDPNWNALTARNGTWIETSFGDGIATDVKIIGMNHAATLTLTKPNDLVWVTLLTINTTILTLLIASFVVVKRAVKKSGRLER